MQICTKIQTVHATVSSSTHTQQRPFETRFKTNKVVSRNCALMVGLTLLHQLPAPDRRQPTCTVLQLDGSLEATHTSTSLEKNKATELEAWRSYLYLHTFDSALLVCASSLQLLGFSRVHLAQNVCFRAANPMSRQLPTSLCLRSVNTVIEQPRVGRRYARQSPSL
jgi:hypothetical protein